jgi:hypothetical protein
VKLKQNGKRVIMLTNWAKQICIFKVKKILFQKQKILSQSQKMRFQSQKMKPRNKPLKSNCVEVLGSKKFYC